MLGGGLGDVGGPSSAAAITEALRWLNPPPGTILHVRSVESRGAQTTTREFWQSAEDPRAQRLRTEGPRTFETSGEELYDPVTDTIYDAPAKPAGRGDPIPPGDPIVAKVRFLLQEGRMVVRGPEVHRGTKAWKISLKRGAGRPVWTLRVATADGKPLELRDPGRDAGERPQVVRWPVYEVLPGTGADKLVTLEGAHPGARVVRDPALVGAAHQRLMPSGSAASPAHPRGWPKRSMLPEGSRKAQSRTP